MDIDNSIRFEFDDVANASISYLCYQFSDIHWNIVAERRMKFFEIKKNEKMNPAIRRRYWSEVVAAGFSLYRIISFTREFKLTRPTSSRANCSLLSLSQNERTNEPSCEDRVKSCTRWHGAEEYPAAGLPKCLTGLFLLLSIHYPSLRPYARARGTSTEGRKIVASRES